MIVPVTPFRQNCSVVWCTKTRQGAVIDPGGDLPRIEQAIASQNVEITKILLTHGHLDHAGGAVALARKFGVGIEGPHPDDAFLLDRLAGGWRRPCPAGAAR